MAKIHLNPCRRCRVSPYTETAPLDGIMQTHVYCPECHSGFWTPPTAKVSAAERWNACNPKSKVKPVPHRMHIPDCNRTPIGCTSDDFSYGAQGGFFFDRDDPEYYS